MDAAIFQKPFVVLIEYIVVLLDTPVVMAALAQNETEQ